MHLFFYVKQNSFEIHPGCYSAFLGPDIVSIISYTMNELVTTDCLSTHQLQIFSMRNLLILPQILFIHIFILLQIRGYLLIALFLNTLLLSGTEMIQIYLAYFLLQGPWLLLMNNGVERKILVLCVLIVSRLCNLHSKKTFTCVY